MFVDKRNSSPNGNTLVITCEGNAGFYEIGTMITPIEAGFSVLGWNHPGFGGSTVGYIIFNIFLFPLRYQLNFYALSVKVFMIPLSAL